MWKRPLGGGSGPILGRLLLLAIPTTTAAQSSLLDPVESNCLPQIQATLEALGPTDDVCLRVFFYDSSVPPPGDVTYISPGPDPICSFFLPHPQLWAAVRAAGQASFRVGTFYGYERLISGAFGAIPCIDHTIPNCCLVPYRPSANPGVLSAAGSTGLGETFVYSVSNPQSANAQVFLLFADAPSAPLPYQTGFLLLDPTTLFAASSLGGVNDTFSVTLGTDPGLVGRTVYAQAVMIDPAVPEGLRFTNGLIVTVR